MHLYRLDAPAAEIGSRFGAWAGKDPWAGGYVTPGRPAPVIVGNGRDDGEWVLRPKLWGVPPPPRGTAPVTHVRNLTSPFWIGTLRHAELRCLIPATSFALWSGPAGARRQLWATLADRPLFAFAGIHRQGEAWPGFAILTVESNRLMRHHGAVTMPLILRAEDHRRWMRADWREAAALVRPFPGQEMQVKDGPEPAN